MSSDTKSNPWLFLGYDLRNIGSYFKAGWSEFLEGKGRAISKSVSKPVKLIDSKGNYHYCVSGAVVKEVVKTAVKKEVEDTQTNSIGVLVPESVLLHKYLSLPQAVESEVESVLALEVDSSSPFSKTETVWGWKITSRSADKIHVLLVITSQLAVEQTVNKCQVHDSNISNNENRTRYEIWANVEDQYVSFITPIQQKRVASEKKATKRLVVALGVSVLLVMAIGAVPAGIKFFEMRKMYSFYHEAEQRSVRAAQWRSELNTNQQLLGDVKALESQYLNPLPLIASLSQQMPDDAFLFNLTIANGEMRMNGRADNANRLIQQLSKETGYSKVEPISAIIRDVHSGQDRFSLSITPSMEANK